MDGYINIDPRIHAVGTAALRKFNASFLRSIKDHAYLIQDGETPVAVLVSYETYLAMQALVQKS